MSERIGIAILCYYDLPSVKAGVASVDAHYKGDALKCIMDNSENDEVGEWARTVKGWEYHRFPYNVGCARSRNWFLARCAREGIQHILVQDQDVVWEGDAAAAMLDVFGQYPSDTGCVTWQLAVTTMGSHTWDKTGKLTPSETPGMCCMYSVPALLAGDDPGLKGWCPRYFVYRFDTDVCFALWSKGYWTRVVTHGQGLVRHEHPHRGQKRLLELGTHRAHSLRVFAERSKRYGWPTL